VRRRRAPWYPKKKTKRALQNAWTWKWQQTAAVPVDVEDCISTAVVRRPPSVPSVPSPGSPQRSCTPPLCLSPVPPPCPDDTALGCATSGFAVLPDITDIIGDEELATTVMEALDAATSAAFDPPEDTTNLSLGYLLLCAVLDDPSCVSV